MKAPLNLNRPVCTLDGRAVRILCKDRSGFGKGQCLSYCVVALVETDIGKHTIEEVVLYTVDGEASCGHDPHGKNWKLKLINFENVGVLL